MQFAELEWHEPKRLSNITKHGLDFRDAPYVLEGPLLLRRAKTVGGEVRRMAIGMLDDIPVSIIFTQRGSVLRLISMRKASDDERNSYDQNFGG